MIVSLQKKYKRSQEKLDSLKVELRKLDSAVKINRKLIVDSVAHVKQEIDKISSKGGLLFFLKKHQLDTGRGISFNKALVTISRIGIGRIWLNYSDLTIQNTSVSGINIELNPGKFYLAVGAGNVNYRFRDFWSSKTIKNQDQALSYLRAGLGQPDQTHLIATFYNGTKSAFQNLVDTIESPNRRIVGFSLEGSIFIRENSVITGEVAKSSYGNRFGRSFSFSELISKSTNFNVSTNFAYSLKLKHDISKTNTRVTAFYRMYGKNLNHSMLCQWSENRSLDD